MTTKPPTDSPRAGAKSLHHGTSLDSLLKEEGVFEETQALAIKELQRAAALVGRKVQIELMGRRGAWGDSSEARAAGQAVCRSARMLACGGGAGAGTRRSTPSAADQHQKVRFRSHWGIHRTRSEMAGSA
jgi:hypothetical protein